MRVKNLSRREFVNRSAAVAAAISLLDSPLSAIAESVPRPVITALTPRDASGHQFVLYSDCTVTGHNAKSTEALTKIGDVIQRLRPQPQFIAFPGDAVGDGTNAGEWEFFHRQIQWTRERNIPVYESTSNHNASSYQAEANFRKYHPEVPLNGPGDQKGLAYWVRSGNLVYVSVHHPAPNGDFRPNYRFADMAWVDEVLTHNADAEYKLVAGHYPVFRVNGYTGMSIPHVDWEPFWSTLRKHNVDAYLTSHVLAFDVQVRDGILQICSGGAGPNTMPEATEGTHAVQIALDRQGLRYQVLDGGGKVRESLTWPFVSSADTTWNPKKHWLPIEVGGPAGIGDSPQTAISLFRISNLTYFAQPHEYRVDLLEGKKGDLRTFQVWIDLLSLRLMVTAEMAEIGPQHWAGPIIDFRKEKMDVQIALHPKMGPGGILWRWSDSSPWNSMETTSEYGLEAFHWPDFVAKLPIYFGGKVEQGKEIKWQVLHTEVPLPPIS